MFCPYCGAQIDGNAPFCGKCGRQLMQQPAYQQPVQQPSYQQPVYQQPIYQQPVYQQFAYQQPAYGQNITWKEFYDLYAAKGTKSSLRWLVAICFLSAGLSLVYVLLGNMLSILDVVLYSVMGLLLLTQKRTIFALIPTVCAVVGTVINLLISGRVSGIFAIIAGFGCVKKLRNLDAAYKEYQATGICPTNQI